MRVAMSIFISYSRVDQAWVDSLDDALRAAGIATWVDRRKIPIALPWFEEIRDAIEVSSCVLVCHSHGFESSAHCAAELSVAAQLGADTLHVSVGSDPLQAVPTVLSYLRGRSPELDLGLHLLGTARTWDRRGRPRRGLLRRRELREFRGADVPAGQRRQLAATFVARSKRRLRIRRTVTGAIALIVVFSAFFSYSLFRVSADDAATSGELAGRLQVQSQGLDLVDDDVYAALALTALLDDTEAALNAAVISAAHEARTPVDAFQVSGELIDSIIAVDQMVIVRTADGVAWQRPADATNERFASLAGETAPSGIDVTAEPLSADIRSGAIVVRRQDNTVRTITPAHSPIVARVSPDRRMVAAAALDRVLIYDIETGHHLISLRGAPEHVTDLAWSQDSTAVWGTGGSWAVKWIVRTGKVLIDDSTHAFRSVMPSPATDEIWLVDESGRLIAVDDDGVVRRELTLDIGDGLSGAMSDDGRFIVVVGQSAVAVVDLSTEGTEILDHQCAQSKPAIVVGEPIAYLSCLAGLVRLPLDNTGSAEVTPLPDDLKRQPIAYDPTSGTIVTSAFREPFYSLDDGELRPLGTDGELNCPTYWLNLVISANGVLHPSGEGTGRISCTVTGRPDGSGGLRWQNGAMERTTTHRSRASVFSTDGQMILTGFADGSIVVWPVENITPQVVYVELSGDVIDIAVDGDFVYAVSRSGMLVKFPTPSLPSNAALAIEAENRLALARELGLVEG